MSKNLYNILGISKDASDTEIKKAYRKMAIKYHPDKNQGDSEAEAKFKDVAEAYEILSDSNKRAQYDAMGYDAFVNGGAGQQRQNPFAGFGNPEDFFNEIRRQHQNENLKRKYSIVQKVKLTMSEIYHGITKKFKYSRSVKCGTCNGKGGENIVRCTACGGKGIRTRVTQNAFGTFRETYNCSACDARGFTIGDKCSNCHGRGVEKKSDHIEIDIPYSVLNGQQMGFGGKGHFYVDERGETYGDLILVIEIDQSKFSMLRDFSLLSKVEVSYETLVLGGEFMFETVDGSTVKVPVSEFSPIGHKLKLKNKGLKNPNFNHIRGDQYILLDLKFPTNISDEEKKLLTQLKKIKE